MDKILLDREEKTNKYAQALFEALHEVRAEDHEKVLDNFIDVLTANGDLGLVGEIERIYVEISQATYSKHPSASQQELEKIRIYNERLVGREDIVKVGGAVFRIDDEE